MYVSSTVFLYPFSQLYNLDPKAGRQITQRKVSANWNLLRVSYSIFAHFGQINVQTSKIHIFSSTWPNFANKMFLKTLERVEYYGALGFPFW
jgi:hypothetical protein